MILGSHNSMTYLKPEKWWMRLFNFVAKCQTRDLYDQHNAGAEVFDIRITFDKETGVPQFAHGLCRYKNTGDSMVEDFIADLDVIDSLNLARTGRHIWVRVMNEHTENKEKFKEFCAHIEKRFPKLKFFCANDKKTWTELYNFHRGHPYMIDKYASCNHDKCTYDMNGREIQHKSNTGWWLDDLCPWVYAYLFNDYWRNQFADKDLYLLQDFI